MSAESTSPAAQVHAQDLDRLADTLARALASAWQRRHGAHDAGASVSADVLDAAQPSAEVDRAA